MTISNNGAGLYLNNSSPIITNARISNNKECGGMQLIYSDPILTNVTINGNTRDGSCPAAGGG